MGRLNRRAVYALAFAAILSASVLLGTRFLPVAQTCGERIGSASITKSMLPSVHFGGVRKFHLEGDRFPNAVTSISDGSVWFGEQNVPGIAHLYPNGSLVEYAWPVTYSPSTTSIWGISEWESKIWATDALGHQVLGVDPSTAEVYAIRTSDVESFPYTVTAGPDNSLWFTELFTSKIGRIDTQCRLTEYSIPTSFGGTPTQIAFLDNTTGYYVDAGNTSSGRGTVLRFDPRQFSPEPVYGSYNLRAPSSLALAPSGVWVAQHSASNIAFYDLNAHHWLFFPTTPVSYEDTTLPYFVASNSSLVWFNEHYANRLARFDTTSGLLTEYSLSDPPASRIVRIDNALTFALSKDRVWFTELTANYVGFVDAAYAPNFTLSTPSNSDLKLQSGGGVNVTFIVSGKSHEPLTFQFADTENFTGRPEKIIMNANVTELQPLDGKRGFMVTIAATKTLPPGDYVLLVSVTDGLTIQGAYLKLQITT